MEKAKLITRPVGWVDDTPIKFQSSLECNLDKKRTIRILSDPKSTEGEAVDDLIVELSRWEIAVSEFKKILKDLK